VGTKVRMKRKYKRKWENGTKDLKVRKERRALRKQAERDIIERY